MSDFTLSLRPVVPPQDHDAFHALHTGLLSTIQPSGNLEQFAFERLLVAAWNVRRAQTLETLLLEKTAGQDPMANPDTQADAKRYQTTLRLFEGSYQRALRELTTLQTTRALNHFTDEECPPLADPQRIQRFADQTQTGAQRELELRYRELDVQDRQQIVDAFVMRPEFRQLLAAQQSAEQTQLPAAAPAPAPPVTPKQTQSASSAPQIAKQTQSVQQPITRAPKIGRNEPCPCGSGQKYKRCCGHHSAAPTSHHGALAA